MSKRGLNAIYTNPLTRHIINISSELLPVERQISKSILNSHDDDITINIFDNLDMCADAPHGGTPKSEVKKTYISVHIV